MRFIRGTEAEINDVHSVITTPVKGTEDHGNIRGELAVEDFDRI